MSRSTIHISCLLKDNKIIAWHVGRNKRTEPSDYYKDFAYANKSMENCDKKYQVEYISIDYEEDVMRELSTKDITNECSFNIYVFDRVARYFFRHWEIHPDHWGVPAY